MTLQGIYDAVGPGASSATLATATARLQELADAGLRVCLNYSAFNGSPANVAAYAKAAFEMGMRLIWPLHHPGFYDGSADLGGTFPALVAAGAPRDSAGLVAYLVNLTKDAPATHGYYVADEPDPARHDALKAHSDRVAAACAQYGHPRLAVHMDVFNGAGRVAPFYDCADELGLDVYPIQRPSGDYSLHAVGNAARALDRLCKSRDRSPVMVLQAFSWAPTYGGSVVRWPTVAEYRNMRDQALANSDARLLLWWARYPMRAAADGDQRWADFRAGVLA